MERIRVGIVGAGNIGSAHAHRIAAGDIAGMVLSALCDTDELRRARLRRKYPEVPVFASHAALLDSGLTDMVLIATPHYAHPVIAADAFRAGQHVLTEKPAGVYTRQVREMNAAAERSGRVFGIMFNQRTDPLFARAREIVRGGRLGAPKRLVWIVTNWYRTQAYYDSGAWRATWSGEGGGVLLNQAPHNLDLWQWIFGMPKRVRAFCSVGKYHHIPVEDDAAIYAEYESGATAAFITTTGEYPGTNRLEISGDRGKLVLEDGRLRWWELDGSERTFCFQAKENSCQAGFVLHEYTDRAEEGHTLILRNFADAVLHGAELLAPGADGLNELTLSNAAYLSAWTDGWAELPLDEAAFEEGLRQRCAAEREKKQQEEDGGLSEDYAGRWQVRW